MLRLISDMRDDITGATVAEGGSIAVIVLATRQSIDDLESAVDWILSSAPNDPEGIPLGPLPF